MVTMYLMISFAVLAIDILLLRSNYSLSPCTFPLNGATTGSEPLTDALLYEPVPYRSALKENCTHVIVLRTRGDDVRVTGKVNIMEKIMVSRYFGRKQKLPELVDWMHNNVRTFNVCLWCKHWPLPDAMHTLNGFFAYIQYVISSTPALYSVRLLEMIAYFMYISILHVQYHKLIYAEDVLTLNEANRDTSEIQPGVPRLYGIAKAAGTRYVFNIYLTMDHIWAYLFVSFLRPHFCVSN